MSRPWLVLLGGVWLAACSNGGTPGDRAAEGGPTGIRFLADADGGAAPFARAEAPRAFEFPADHGPHPAFRTEWWYFTGNLHDETDRHFGFELTFFRVGLDPAPDPGGNRWRTQQIWMAHFALTDTARGRFVAAERLSRGALELAGAQTEPFRVWVEDWSVEAPSGVLEDGILLRAADDRAGIELTLQPVTPHVAQGNGGLDPKGPEPGNASFYYSMPRLSVAGSLVDTQGSTRRVTGEAWMDREWSTSALDPGLEGWDWFALQLDDGRNIMLYRLRERDGATSPFSAGSVAAPDGSVVRLGAEDFELAATRTWTSEATGASYPVAWRVRLPSLGLGLEISPRLDDQELDLSVRYWEGAVRVEGTEHGRPVEGHGYLELSGY